MPLRNITVKTGASIREALQVIDRGAIQIALVVDEQDRLVGSVTDGDIRRGLLRGVSLDDAVDDVCNKNPITAEVTDDSETINDLMIQKGLLQIPVLDEDGRIIRIKSIDDIVRVKKKDNLVVLMAGGKGTRLRPLTRKTPKPLLKVGNKPILETIIENFGKYGFHNIVISVRYKADMIKNYFGDGAKWGVNIDYIEEPEPMGTAGALALLNRRVDEPFFVMNSDLLTKVNFLNLLEYHETRENTATMCVREFNLEVPYGVVRTDENTIMEIKEKPVQNFFINAGIYLLNPGCLGLIPKDKMFDMPDLFKELINREQTVRSFPVREYWLDIGRMSDLEQANMDYENNFDEYE